MHILIAPNAFKHGVSAIEAAAAISRGLGLSRFGGTWATCPVGDGGDGTAQVLHSHLGGRLVTAAAHDALGRPISSRFALVENGRTAVIELAEASGLHRLRREELDPSIATTTGTGELILSALALGVRDIVLCVGGSATVDCGAGILQALGVRFLSAAGDVLTCLPLQFLDLSTIDTTHIDPRLSNCKLTVVCDVANPLVGARGAARTFGPQKGATVAGVQMLERALERFADVASLQSGKDVAKLTGGGAAGGVAAGLAGVLDATLVTGIDYVLKCIDFDAALATADMVITGEGTIDEQTPDGKAPWGVALRAKAKGAFVLAFGGQVPLVTSPRLRSCFDAVIPIGNAVSTRDDAIELTAANLQRASLEVGNVLGLCQARPTSAD